MGCSGSNTGQEARIALVMKIEKRNIVAHFVVLLLISSCGTKSNKVLVEKYYKDGNISSRGWYIGNKNKVPVDTLYQFFENENLFSISVYDSLGSGRLNGISILFYQNGNKYQVGNYVNGVAQGFYYQYDTLGILETKQFYFDDKPVGDHFEYDEDGMVQKYAFYWTDSVYASCIEYDESGMIKPEFNERPVLFNYFTNVRTDSTANKIQKVCKISIIPSNPPKCRTKVNIYFYSGDGSLLKRDSAENVELYQREYFLPDSLKMIKYTALQYDSIIGKYYNGMFKTEL